MITALTNMNALQAQNTLFSLQQQDAQTMQQLSTGQQLNSAANNPAALAISKRLQEQSTGNSQAIKNIQEGLSMIQTADGGLANIQSIIQKMRTLVIEAQNTTLSSSDVNSLQQEYNSLANTLNQISVETKYNNIPLLDRGTGLHFNGINGLLMVPDSSSLNSISTTMSIEVKFDPSNQFGILVSKMPNYNPSTYYGLGPYWLEMYGGGGNVNYYLRVNNAYPADMPVYEYINFNQVNDLVATFNGTTGQAKEYLNGHLIATGSTTPGTIPNSPGPLVFGSGKYGGGTFFNGTMYAVRLYNQVLSSTDVLNNYQGQITQNGLIGNWLLNEAQGNIARDNSGNGNNATIENATWVNPPINLQVGSKSTDTFSLTMPSVSSSGLGINGISITSPLALNFLNDALNVVTGQRQSLGAQQMQLEAQRTNLQSSIVMTKSANSQIKDANMTQQMSELTKNQVQQQMSLSMLNAANQSPKILFKLLS